MNWRDEWKAFLWISGFFLFAWWMPVETETFREAVVSAFELTKWYAREHVILCLIPAFFIAGVIAVFVSQASVIKYFGAGTKKWISYTVASVSGTVLAVCSCTILPLFAGIYKRGAGIGPAVAFLYSGPAINILAIILTARILGWELGVARVIAAVLFAVIIGLLMHFLYWKEEADKVASQMAMPMQTESRPLWQTSLHFFTLVLILVFVNWGTPAENSGLWAVIYNSKWSITALLGIVFAGSLIWIIKLNKVYVGIAALLVLISVLLWPETPLIPFVVAVIVLSVILSFDKNEGNEWMGETWGFARQIMPLLALGVIAAGFLLGSQEGGRGLIPNEWIASLVGGNSLWANLFASVAGAFMYFATLTEIPILQGLLQSGMGQGPALALLLAGPALSLPNMLVIRSVMGTKKTFVFVLLVIIMATISGMIFGNIIQ
jgi:uncharacterized protein